MILIDKPPGVSSFAALGAIKRLLGTGKIGHTGTLDPFATGLLVVLVGTYTRLAGHISGLDKRYEMTVCFGSATDTLDRDGSVNRHCDPPSVESLRAVLPQFCGRLSQIPPAYSAVRIGGRRAYEMARSGAEVELAPRQVELFDVRLCSYVAPLAELEVHCSKGTYMRSLARDIAEAAGSCAHLQQLRRTAVGPFSVRDAVPAEELDPARDLHSAARFIDALPGFVSLTVSEKAASRVRNGGRIAVADFVAAHTGGPLPVEGRASDAVLALFDTERSLLALADYDGESFRYRCVLAEPDRRGRQG